MNILAVNASPAGKQSTTEVLTRLFLEGAAEVGAQVRTIYLNELDIRPCAGCFACWMVTPGKCRQSDAMAELLMQLETTDVIVFGTPLYGYCMTSTMKGFIDRLLPLTSPSSSSDGGGGLRKGRGGDRIRSILVSNCASPDTAGFSALVSTFEMMFGDCLDVVVRRTRGRDFKQAESPQVAEVWGALRRAGSEYVQTGQIDRALLDTIEQP